MTRPLSWIAATAFAILSIGPSLAAPAASPVGQWQVTTGEARYTVSSCGAGLCAKLVWLRSDARTKDNLALMNKYVVRGAQPAGKGTWTGNLTMNGNSYAGTMQLVSKNYLTLKASASRIACRSSSEKTAWE